MTERRIEALRQMAERGGTAAERQRAREILERIKGRPIDREESFRKYIWSGSLDDLARAAGPHICDCGTEYPAFSHCGNVGEHESIRAEIRRRFPRGTRVFYNCWAYGENDPGVVTGFPVKPFRDDWRWIRIKFDRLKAARSVPIWTAKGCHLSTEPVSREILDQTGLGGFTRAEKEEMEREIRHACGVPTAEVGK